MSDRSGRTPSADALKALCDRYGLESNPFAPAPERFYGGGQRQQFLDSLRHLCAFGDMFLAVAGAPGSGRTRLLTELVRQEKPNLDFRPLSPSDCASVTALALALSKQLRQLPPATSDPHEVIMAFFSASHWGTFTGKRWVLVIDDADQMPIETVEALALGFDASARDRAPVPLVLSSPEWVDGFRARLKDRHVLVHTLNLKPLSLAEARDFVVLCFEWAGADPAGILDSRRTRQLHERSAGYFDRLKQTAPEVILGAGAPSESGVADEYSAMGSYRSRITPQAKRPARKKGRRQTFWALLALILLSLSYGIVSWQYRGPDEAVPDAVGLPKAEAPPAISEMERLREAMTAAEARIRPEPLPAEQAEPKELPAAQEARIEAVVEPANPPLLPASIGMSVEELISMAVKEPFDATPPKPESALTVSVPGEPGGALDAVGPDSVAQVEGETTSDQSKLPLTEETEADAVDPAPEQGFTPALPETYGSRSWVAEIDPGTHTLQLLGSYRETTAIELVSKHPNVDLVYVRSTYKGRPWFVVLYGLYPDRGAAAAAIESLPLALRRIEPWIRTTDGL